jgi:cytochrome c oxidase subunit II
MPNEPVLPPGPLGCRAISAWRRAAPAVLLATGQAGCAGIQSAVDARGIQAQHISDLWWVLLILCTVVFVAVMVALFLALFRRGRTVTADSHIEDEPAATRVITGAVGVTIVILVGLVVYSAMVGRAITTLPDTGSPPIEVEVIGHQWWWEVRYLDEAANRTFTTANELRVPVGRPVIVKGLARDVIHSFWVPNLHGKVDLIPGRVNYLWFQADEPGIMRGQCAEFCGLQHAKMAFVVVAEPPEQFEAWREAYWQRSRVPPATDEAARGEEVFLASQCSMCHTVRGTSARASVGPDLTRLAIRQTLAAGTLPNTRGHLGAWLLDPQHIKPGSFMPPTNIEPDDLHALLTYLMSLE